MNYKEICNQYNISVGLPNDYYKIIFVDCMDTIVSRDVSLNSLLSLWAKKLGRDYNLYPKFLHYYRQEVVSSAMHNTVSINGIYGELYNHCKHFDLIGSCTKEAFVERAHQVELDLEVHHQHVISDTINYLYNAKKGGSQIYCVSDFRLSSADIMRFFSHKGVDNLFSGVFSSADIGMTKKEGSLYNYVINSIKNNVDNCVMIGDNLISDCVNANKNGIKGFWLKDHNISLRKRLRM